MQAYLVPEGNLGKTLPLANKTSTERLKPSTRIANHTAVAPTPNGNAEHSRYVSRHATRHPYLVALDDVREVPPEVLVLVARQEPQRAQLEGDDGRDGTLEEQTAKGRRRAAAQHS